MASSTRTIIDEKDIVRISLIQSSRTHLLTS